MFDIKEMSVEQLDALHADRNTTNLTYNNLKDMTSRIFDLAFHESGISSEHRSNSRMLLPSIIRTTLDVVSNHEELLASYCNAVSWSCCMAVFRGAGSPLWDVSHDSNGSELSNELAIERLHESLGAYDSLRLVEVFCQIQNKLSTDD